LTVRKKADLEPEAKQKERARSQEPLDFATQQELKEEVIGVFVVTGERAEFRKVETGITGSTEIEVLSGLESGDQVVTGSYQVIRTMRNGARVKIDNRSNLVSAAKG
jgi:HlyD family secretion protein